MILQKIIHRSNVPKKIPKGPFFEIREVSVVGKGFALEADIAVGFVMVAVVKPSDKVLQQIPQVERNDT